MAEPTAALTDAEVETLFVILNKLRARGVAMIYISHKLDEVFRITDRVTVLRDGRTIGTSPTKELDEAGVIAKFGVPPASIPDYLALVGDSADGYPGLAGWGAKSTAAVLAKFGHIESIPESAREWHVNVLNTSSLADTLVRDRRLALLFRTLATLRSDIPLFDNVDRLRWAGPTADFDAIGKLLDKAVTEKKPKTR